jgi:signal peptidase I
VSAAPIRKPRLRVALGLGAALIVIIVLTIGIRAVLVGSYIVPSGSMLPTLQIGDRIVVDKLSSTIHRGDIVVFRRAPGDHDAQYPILVKRVIGLPGETISSVGDTVLIDGRPLAEPWVPKLAGACDETAESVPVTRIPAGQYFVMGDCRAASSDSRDWGTVPLANIVGKVTAVVWRHNHPWFHWF